MSIVCFGSLAFDRLMTYPGYFTDHLIADKLDQLSLSLLVDKVTRVYGGTAGNIGYNLQLLGEKPFLAGSLGDDPDGLDYVQRIEGWGLPLNGVKQQNSQMTAGCIIVSDNRNSQFTFFHPGAMNLSTGFDLATLPGKAEDHLVIISPGGAEEMKSLAADCRRLGIKFIFDPGQQIPALGGEGLKEAVDGASILICNKYELDMFTQATGLSTEDIFNHVEAVIVTRGEEGSDLLVHGRGSQHIMTVPVRTVGNPTGAGDAFRAGLLKGLVMGEHLISACRLGATVAAFCVEADGTQTQNFTKMEVMARHASVFNEQINLLA